MLLRGEAFLAADLTGSFAALAGAAGVFGVANLGGFGRLGGAFCALGPGTGPEEGWAEAGGFVAQHSAATGLGPGMWAGVLFAASPFVGVRTWRAFFAGGDPASCSRVLV